MEIEGSRYPRAAGGDVRSRSCYFDAAHNTGGTERARRFWSSVLSAALEPRRETEGEGWERHAGAPKVGVHAHGRGPGDSFSLPYCIVDNLPAALERVTAFGGTAVHPGAVWRSAATPRAAHSA